VSEILYFMPGVGVSKEEKSRREGIANTFLASPANHVTVDNSDEGPLSIESSIESDMCIPGMLRKVIALKGRFDAMIVGCADDPGLFSLREALDAPVVGPLESSIAVSTLLGDRFAIIMPTKEGFPETRMILRKYRSEERCASLRAVDCTVQGLMGQKTGRPEVLDRFVAECKEAVREGAASIILGCMSLAFLLLDEMARGEVPVPVVNPAKVAVKTAEMLLALGVSHSRASYPRPDLEKLRHSVLPGV
jgi:allantoin racemase